MFSLLGTDCTVYNQAAASHAPVGATRLLHTSPAGCHEPLVENKTIKGPGYVKRLRRHEARAPSSSAEPFGDEASKRVSSRVKGRRGVCEDVLF